MCLHVDVVCGFSIIQEAFGEGFLKYSFSENIQSARRRLIHSLLSSGWQTHIFLVCFITSIIYLSRSKMKPKPGWINDLAQSWRKEIRFQTRSNSGVSDLDLTAMCPDRAGEEKIIKQVSPRYKWYTEKHVWYFSANLGLFLLSGLSENLSGDISMSYHWLSYQS